MPGEAYALICAFLWALSSALLKSQADKMRTVTLGALRTVPAIALYWGIVLFSGRLSEIAALSSRTWAFLAGSSLIGLIVGDLFYYASMKRIGLARAMPLSAIYPFFTMLFALLFLDETVGWGTAVGALLIIVGSYLLAVPSRIHRSPSSAQRIDWIGIGMAIISAVCWGASTVMVRVGVDGVSVPVANAIRLSILIVVWLSVAVMQGGLEQVRSLETQSLLIVMASGILGAGLGTFAFLSSVHLAGATKTSILTATTPLFGVPLAFVLGERTSMRTVLGTLCSIAGVWLTVSAV